MPHIIFDDGTVQEYRLRRSMRTKNMTIRVLAGGEVRVATHTLVPLFLVQRFVQQKAKWLKAQVSKMSVFPARKSKKQKKEAYLFHKEAARALTQSRIKVLNLHYKFQFERISIRNQSSRWGSCSKKGNLNFNYRLALLPPHLADYVIVHELCHLKEFNHSQKFWNLVAEKVPNYQAYRKELKQLGLLLI